MNLKVVQKLIPVSRYEYKSKQDMKPIGLCVHNTANEAPAVNEVSYMTGTNTKTSFHYAVDDIQAVQALPENRTAWHAGDNLGQGNMKHIGIEICYSLAKKLPEKDVYAKFEKAERNAVILIVDMLRRYGWGLEQIKKHQDFSGKYCPHRTLDLGWDRFLNMVRAEIIGTPFKKGDVIQFTKRGKLFHKSGEHWGYAEIGAKAKVMSVGEIKGAYQQYELGFNNVANVMCGYGENFVKSSGESTRTDGTVETPQPVDPCKELKEANKKLVNDLKLANERIVFLEGYKEQAEIDYKELQGMYNHEAEEKRTYRKQYLDAQLELDNYKKMTGVDLVLAGLNKIFKVKK